MQEKLEAHWVASGPGPGIASPFANPIYQGVQADLFYCGLAGAEKAIVEQLIPIFGEQCSKIKKKGKDNYGY